MCGLDCIMSRSCRLAGLLPAALILCAFFRSAVPAVAADAAMEPVVIEAADTAVAALPETAQLRGPINISGGVAFTTDYISDGLTQTDNKPAVQPWIEAQQGIFYTGIWLSNVELEPDSLEIDLTMGIRPSIGALSLDINYTAYVYDETGNCCGQFIIEGTYAATNKLSLNGALQINPEGNGYQGIVGAYYQFADAWSLSGSFEQYIDEDFWDWNIGGTWNVTKATSLDLRYYDNQLQQEAIVATVAWKFSTAK
jgi:uncharacterized protein (TIGR02001 family)